MYRVKLALPSVKRCTNIVHPLVKELQRKRLWEEIVASLYDVFGVTKPKEKYGVRALLLRYLFAKIITRQVTDDPIFIQTPSILALNQLRFDLAWKGLRIAPEYVASQIELGFAWARNQLQYTPVEITPSVTPNWMALRLRYNYIELGNRGLAMDYAAEGWEPYHPVLECFASAFNHYFDNWCSAFPDLETALGSRGSFFDLHPREFLDYNEVNPPFDETIIRAAILYVYAVMDWWSGSGIRRVFRFILPWWSDFTELLDLRSQEGAVWQIYPKGTLPFIDEHGKYIYPCDVITVTLTVE